MPWNCSDANLNSIINQQKEEDIAYLEEVMEVGLVVVVKEVGGLHSFLHCLEDNENRHKKVHRVLSTSRQ